MKILFNHIGYAPADEKVLLIEAPQTAVWREIALVALPGCKEVWRGAIR